MEFFEAGLGLGDAFFQLFLLFLDPLGVEDSVAVDKGELGVHQVYAFLEDGYGLSGLIYQGEEVFVGKAVEGVKVVGLDEKGYLAEGLDISFAVGAGGLYEKVALFPALVRMKVWVKGLGNHPVEVPEFFGFLLAEAGGVEVFLRLLEFGLLLLYACLVLPSGGFDLFLDAIVVYGGVVVDVRLGKADLQLGKLDLDAKLELLKEEDTHGGFVQGVEHWTLFELHILRLGEEPGGLLAQFLQLGLEGRHLRMQGDGLSCRNNHVLYL